MTSLGEIEHESVFAPVLMAFADEAREVRAAAARSLSRMNFDRAEGYVRLIETADEETLRRVASACIKAGMVGQAIDRVGRAKIAGWLTKRSRCSRCWRRPTRRSL